MTGPASARPTAALTVEWPTRMTLTEWGAIADRIGGEGRRDTPFRCPLCGNVATPRMWKDAGGDPNLAPQACIGRLIGAKGGLNVTLKRGQAMPQPCDWAAFGLFSVGETITLVTDEGKEIRVFPFDADPSLSAALPDEGDDRG